MRVLIVFEEVPEVTKMVVVENPSEDEIAVLEKAHGKFIDSDEDTEFVNVLMNWIAPSIDYCEDPDMDDNCKWKRLVIDPSKEPISGPFDRVYFAGIMC